MDTGPTIRDFNSLSSIVRALNLLEFVGETGLRSLSEIAAFTGLPKSTLLRLIGTLVEQGFLQRVQHGEYGIGMKLWRIGCTAIDLENVREFVIQVMRRLTEETGETSLYAVYDGGKAVYVEKVEGVPSYPRLCQCRRILTRLRERDWQGAAIGAAAEKLSGCDHRL
jgi:DNA-binding IclR family transcriptional regulator